MAINRIILNETSYFGFNARSVLTDEIKKRGFKKALVVSDKNLVENQLTKKVTSLLDENNLSYSIFSNIKPNPTVESIKEGVLFCKEINADYILAIGGGSSIDVAKAIGIIITNPEFSDVVSLEGLSNTKNKSLPIIALPTTAGTAAEVTINYVITDEQSVKKMVCVDPNDIPVLSIIDTELMSYMPSKLIAATGMDALTHAIEGYITKAAWSMTDMFHIEAIKIIFENLKDAVIEKKQSAIDKMGVAQYIAGMGFSNVGLGIVHSMAHSLGAFYDTPHGVANALLLPHVMEYNGVKVADRYREICEALNFDVNNLSNEEVIKLLVNKVKSLSIEVDIPQTLREIGANQEDIPSLAEKAFNDVCTGGNPRETSVEDIIKIYNDIF
ncbi:MAG: lactaldehyde reductase [Bacilli bacterium]|nr:lactaldehyde reductase [Bacilli bacterium]